MSTKKKALIGWGAFALAALILSVTAVFVAVPLWVTVLHLAFTVCWVGCMLAYLFLPEEGQR